MESLNLERLSDAFIFVYRLSPKNPMTIQLWDRIQQRWEPAYHCRTECVRDELIHRLVRSDAQSVMLTAWDERSLRRILNNGLIPVNLALHKGRYFFEWYRLDGDRLIHEPMGRPESYDEDPDRIEPPLAFINLMDHNDLYVADFRLHRIRSRWRRCFDALLHSAAHALRLLFPAEGPLEESPHRTHG